MFFFVFGGCRSLVLFIVVPCFLGCVVRLAQCFVVVLFDVDCILCVFVFVVVVVLAVFLCLLCVVVFACSFDLFGRVFDMCLLFLYIYMDCLV